MFGEKAIGLIKECHRTPDSLPAYNSDLVEQVSKEIRSLVEENHTDARQIEQDARAPGFSTIRIRHVAIQRNIRCLLAYHHTRIRCLRQMRWEFGSILPPEIKSNLSQDELAWFSRYSSHLAKYMRSIGDEGVNLGVDLKPPKSLYMQVNCLLDYGKYQLNDGSIILLKKDTVYYLPRVDCEELIRLKVFEHIV